MSTLGPFCESAKITVELIKSQDVPRLNEIRNGLIIELKAYCDGENYTANEFVALLCDIEPSFRNVSVTAIVNKLKYVKDQKKKLAHKKKVKGVKNVAELLNKTFSCPVPNTPTRPTSVPSPEKNSFNRTSPTKTCETDVPIVPIDLNKSVQTETSSCSLKSELKDVNILKYKTKLYTRKLDKVKEELTNCQENLYNLKGHYSLKNVKKRDDTARRNLQKLRQTQRTVIKQDRLLNMRVVEKQTSNSLKQKNEQMKNEIIGLKDTIESLSERIDTEISKKIVLQKSNSYLKMEISNLRTQVNQSYECECAEHITRMETKLIEKEQHVLELEDKLSEIIIDSVETKTEKGMYKDNIRLCIMELAGLEVATEKMSPVIKTVATHVFGKKIKDLPNATSSQKIIDEGHFICKAFIADKIENAELWGIGRDGTTRRKQKILDTSVTLDSGDVMSLGFTRVANETADTIQTVTQNHLNQLTTLKKNPEYLVETLDKLAFTMSDRASNEKKADRLLDEWRNKMLEDYDGNKEDVLHFHCMAHVLLGLHNYTTPALKDFEQSLKNESPESDPISSYNPWKSESVANRVVRQVAETFGPAGNHLGVRDRWEAFCSRNGVKSLIGNYKDNRFNAFFQTAAEVFTHRKDFVSVLETVMSQNGKLVAVKKDLESTNVAAILQALGLFYFKVTGPYWNLVTCGKVPYLQLSKHVAEIVQFLETLETDPAQLLIKDEHWSPSDPLDIKMVPHYKVLQESLFNICEGLREIVLRVVPVIAASMLKCIRKQLVDFLPGGKFHDVSNSRTDFAPVTNLSCEHHFGDLDSSQKRRPRATFHHHSSIQMLKRSRKHVMNWINKMTYDDKAVLMANARKGGRQMRKDNQHHEKQVLDTINNKMDVEKEKKLKKLNKMTTNSVKRKLPNDVKSSTKRKRIENPHPQVSNKEAPVAPINNEVPTPPMKLCNPVPPMNLCVNGYVAVAYQDDWYPGCIQKLIDENTAVISFMTHCSKPGFYQWPSRPDTQVVEKQYVLCADFVPDCVGSGRQWFVSEHENISAAYAKYSTLFF